MRHSSERKRSKQARNAGEKCIHSGHEETLTGSFHEFATFILIRQDLPFFFALVSFVSHTSRALVQERSSREIELAACFASPPIQSQPQF